MNQILNIDYALPLQIQGRMQMLIDIPSPDATMSEAEIIELQIRENVILEEILGMEDLLVEHAEGIAAYRREALARRAGIEREIQRLESLAIECEVHATRSEKVLMKIAEIVPSNKLKSATFTMTLKKNPPAVNVYNEDAVPDAYKYMNYTLEPVPMDKAEAIEAALQESGLLKSIKMQVSKREISDALKNGIPVNGCELTQSNRLEIK